MLDVVGQESQILPAATMEVNASRCRRHRVSWSRHDTRQDATFCATAVTTHTASTAVISLRLGSTMFQIQGTGNLRSMCELSRGLGGPIPPPCSVRGNPRSGATSEWN